MAWIITNGRQYIKRDHNNTPVCTSHLHNAVRFDDAKKANNYCNSLPRTFKNLGYYVAEVQAPSVAPSVTMPTAPEVKDIKAVIPEKATISDVKDGQIDATILDFENFASQIQNFSEFVATAIKQRPLLVEAQLQTEMEIMDIEHAAEFYNWNAAKGYRAFRMLRDARIRRRQYKDAIRWIDMLIEANPTAFIEKNIPGRMNETQQRVYHPRAFPELFAEARS